MRVSFPKRTIKANLASRMLYPILNVIRQGVHASFGVRMDIFPLGDVSGKQIGSSRVEARAGDVVFHLR